MFGYLPNNQYLCALKAKTSKPYSIDMIVTGRDFRANQSRYISIAHSGEDVILKSRAGSVRLIPVDTKEATEKELNRVYIEDGEVKMELQSDTMSIDEAKRLTMKMIDLEYALP